MKIPQISIVVPVFNTEKYLNKCIETLCGQTFTDIEILCIDDGSNDESGKILDYHACCDSRVKVVHRKVPSGSAAVPRNIGIEMAHGKYIIFLDSDDYFSPLMLETMYEIAEEKEADLVMCDNYIVDFETGEISEENTELHIKYLPRKEIFSYTDIPDTIFQISNAAAWHRLILREVIVDKKLRFQTGVPILDDIYFVNASLVFAHRICITRERLVYYRKCRPGAQTTSIAKHKDSVYKAFSTLIDRLRVEGIYDVVKFSLQNWILATMAWWLHSIGDYATFVSLFNLYKKKYFSALDLMDVKSDELYDELEGFYKSVVEHEARPSLMVILESLLPPHSKIAIYGAGVYGKKIYNAIESHGKHKVSFWCDKRALLMKNPLVSLPEKIKEADFDAVIIAIVDSKIVCEVKQFLIKLGVEESKIHVL